MVAAVRHTTRNFRGQGSSPHKKAHQKVSLGYYSGLGEAVAKGDFQERGGTATTVMATTNLLSDLEGVMGRFNVSFCDVARPTMVGSNATENVSNFTPLDWPRKASTRLKFCLLV